MWLLLLLLMAVGPSWLDGIFGDSRLVEIEDVGIWGYAWGDFDTNGWFTFAYPFPDDDIDF